MIFYAEPIDEDVILNKKPDVIINIFSKKFLTNWKVIMLIIIYNLKFWQEHSEVFKSFCLTNKNIIGFCFLKNTNYIFKESKWVSIDEILKLKESSPGWRGPELYEWAKYLEDGGVIFPL